MAVRCTNCGKSYIIDSKSINYEGNRKAYFKCTNCHNKVIFDKFKLNSTHPKRDKIIQASVVPTLQNEKNENQDPSPLAVKIVQIPFFGLRMKMK